MLRSIKSLKTFIFTGSVWLAEDPAFYATLSRALRHHGQSLKYLALSSITHADDMHGSLTHSRLEFGNGFPVLTTFYGPLSSLLNQEKLGDRRHLEAISAILPAAIEDLLLEVRNLGASPRGFVVLYAPFFGDLPLTLQHRI
jgi:hypothetical protein